MQKHQQQEYKRVMFGRTPHKQQHSWISCSSHPRSPAAAAIQPQLPKSSARTTSSKPLYEKHIEATTCLPLPWSSARSRSLSPVSTRPVYLWGALLIPIRHTKTINEENEDHEQQPVCFCCPLPPASLVLGIPGLHLHSTGQAGHRVLCRGQPGKGQDKTSQEKTGPGKRRLA